MGLLSKKWTSRGTTILQCARTVKHGIAPMTATAESYVHAAAQDAGAVAELAAGRKTTKHAALESRYLFQPIAVESPGPINCSAVSFLSGLGRRIAEISGETRDGSFLFQRVSVLIQRFNAVLLHDCFVG